MFPASVQDPILVLKYCKGVCTDNSCYMSQLPTSRLGDLQCISGALKRLLPVVSAKLWVRTGINRSPGSEAQD